MCYEGANDVFVLFLGFAFTSLNIYMAELAPAKMRGKFLSLGSTFLCFSLFVCTLVSGLFSTIKTDGWRSVTVKADAPYHRVCDLVHVCVIIFSLIICQIHDWSRCCPGTVVVCWYAVGSRKP